MLYFAYGSNMCTGRLQRRVPSATPVGVARLLNHAFRFHKRSGDGSAKADAFFTGEPRDFVCGVLFAIDAAEEWRLDQAEGLGRGYVKKSITVEDSNGEPQGALMYAAQGSHIDANLRPYAWYKRFVVEGARQHGLPQDYVARIEAVAAGEDPDGNREAQQRAIAC